MGHGSAVGGGHGLRNQRVKSEPLDATACCWPSEFRAAQRLARRLCSCGLRFPSMTFFQVRLFASAEPFFDDLSSHQRRRPLLIARTDALAHPGCCPFLLAGRSAGRALTRSGRGPCASPSRRRSAHPLTVRTVVPRYQLAYDLNLVPAVLTDHPIVGYLLRSGLG